MSVISSNKILTFSRSPNDFIDHFNSTRSHFSSLNVASLSDFWNQLNKHKDIMSIVIMDPIDQTEIYDLLASLPSIPTYVNIPIILIHHKDNCVNNSDLISMGVNHLLQYPEPGLIDVFIKELETVIQEQSDRFSTLKSLQSEVQSRITAIQSLEEGNFKIRTREEAQHLASLLSISSKEPTLLAIGISELAINGVEHGMLGITHDDKNRMITEGVLSEEVKRLASLKENRDKFVEVVYQKTPSHVTLTVTDPGTGFDYHTYLDAKFLEKQNEKMAKHGRGIGMAKAIFQSLKYQGNGNSVIAVFALTSE